MKWQLAEYDGDRWIAIGPAIEAESETIAWNKAADWGLLRNRIVVHGSGGDLDVDYEESGGAGYARLGSKQFDYSIQGLKIAPINLKKYHNNPDYDEEPDYDEIGGAIGMPVDVACPVCGGNEATVLGRLGDTIYYRCRDCGTDFSDENDVDDEERSYGPHRARFHRNPYYDNPRIDVGNGLTMLINEWKIKVADWPTVLRNRKKVYEQIKNASIQMVKVNDKKSPVKLVTDVKIDDPYYGPLQNFTVFGTGNTKMNCPSFTLPAANEGEFLGSCPAQALTNKNVAPNGIPINHEKFVCDICYAGKDRYPILQTGLMVKMAWVRRTLESTFVPLMIEGLAHLFDKLDPDMKAQGGDRYFRVHDSGDFFHPAYIRAWNAITREFLGVKFWAPTRTWVYPQFLEAMREAPSNFNIRPSALNIGDPVPSEAGLAGSTVNYPLEKEDGVAKLRWTELNGERVWICPAYRHEKDKKGASCYSEKCRVCWDSKFPVSYTEH